VGGPGISFHCNSDTPLQYISRDPARGQRKQSIEAAMTAPPAFRFATLAEVRTRTPPVVHWLWDGYLAAGNITLLTSRWKAGKTTLLSVLLARLGTGGTVAGRAVRAGRAVVVSEEGEDLWAVRDARLHFGPNVRLLSRPFAGKPTWADWEALIDSLCELRATEGLDLVVIDPLAGFLPGRSENEAGLMLEFLLPLQRLTAAGVAVLILHHPRKQAAAAGQAARGSGALTGAADILIELEPVSHQMEDDRRRRLWAFSRHPETPTRLVIELTADGTDYAGRGDFANPEQADGWPVLLGVLEDAKDRLTRQQIRAQWPADYPRPDEITLWRWLDRAVVAGKVLRDGTGRRNEPFRYWLPGAEEQWANDPMTRLLNSFGPLPDLRPFPER
jgi:hypothetical protein